MKILYTAFAATLMFSAAACSKPAATPTTTTAAAPAFVINDLAENDANIQGCSTMFSRVGAHTGGQIFVEDGVDQGAKGFIRIDGALVNVDLVSVTHADDTHGVRTFADAAHTVQVVETYTIGASHEESDSVDETATLTVTAKGATQTVAAEGGTAC